jgi:FkbM family methyltransferase
LQRINFSALASSTLVGKVARYPLRILPRSMAVPILRGPLKGTKWIVGSQRHACWMGIYEPFLQKRMAEEVRTGGVFYDVGANVGFYSLLASGLIGSGKVFAFEPLPANIRHLVQHLKLNRVKNVEIFEMAICDQTGTSLFQAEETGAMGRLQATGGVRVTTSTLDVLVHEQRIAPPSYIKMDIEGAEYRALVGAEECFRRHRPKLFLATHGRQIQEECCRILHSWGYDLRFLNVEADGMRADIFATFGRET